MDLFDDIPEPTNNEGKLNATKARVVTSLLKPAKGLTRSNQCFTSKGLDLFGDLPSPSDVIPNTKSNGAVDSKPNANQKRKVEEDPSIDNAKRTQSEPLFELRGCVAERKGEREEMQDAHTLLDNFKRHMSASLHPSVHRLAMYAVYDGHGGSRASRYMATRFPGALAATFPKDELSVIERDLKKFLIDSFKRVDEDFLREAARHKPSWKDGTTATVVLVLNNILYISNLGDSKAVLCRYCPETQKYSPVLLSKDHSPTDYNERMRIQKAGGNVKDGRVLGILEVSRSIGDGQFKRCGVICVPEIRRCQLTEHDKFLLLGCDGLWKVFTSDQALHKVNKFLEDESLEGTEDKTADEIRLEAACNYLACEAVRKLSGDNVTVLLVRILPYVRKS